MSIFCEFFASCDRCGMYAGEDRGEADDVFSSAAAAVESVRAAGWHVTDEHDHVMCPGCRLEHLHELAHSKATR